MRSRRPSTTSPRHKDPYAVHVLQSAFHRAYYIISDEIDRKIEKKAIRLGSRRSVSLGSRILYMRILLEDHARIASQRPVLEAPSKKARKYLGHVRSRVQAERAIMQE